MTNVPISAAWRSAVRPCRLLRSRRYQLVFVDSELLDGGLNRMERFHDKRLSLTDCVSMELIERLDLDGAFTFDADFRACGLIALP